jgi:anti-sigma regulatory factor (Ser/Thr protein kinase)
LGASIELEIPARPEYVALARLVVSSLASSRRDLTDDRVDDLKVAVSEACTNAIEAHHTADSDDSVVVRCIELDDRLEVEIEDRGARHRHGDPGAVRRERARLRPGPRRPRPRRRVRRAVRAAVL